MYCRKWFAPTPGRCQCWLIIMGRITILVAGSGSRVRPEGFIAYNGAVSNPEKTIRLTRPAREDLLFTSPGDRYFLLSQLSSAELVDRNTPVTPSRFSDSNSDHPPASVGAVLLAHVLWSRVTVIGTYVNMIIWDIHLQTPLAMTMSAGSYAIDFEQSHRCTYARRKRILVSHHTATGRLSKSDKNNQRKPERGIGEANGSVQLMKSRNRKLNSIPTLLVILNRRRPGPYPFQE